MSDLGEGGRERYRGKEKVVVRRKRIGGGGGGGEERGHTDHHHCRLFTNSMRDLDLRMVGVVARTASMLLLFSPLDLLLSASSSKNEKEH